MIVRERPDSFVLVRQHEHALISGEFARHWRDGHYPLGPTLYAISYHDVAWRELDEDVLWNEDRDRPYSFVDYPVELKLPYQRRGIELVESHDSYAGCLCSMHYAGFLIGSERPIEVEFRERELDRQEKLRKEMSATETEGLERNFRFLRLCDGLSLFLCLNEPGRNERPPPYPGGFEHDGTRFEPVWEDERTLRLDPNPFTEEFEVSIPYQTVGRDRKLIEDDNLSLRIVR